MLFVLVKKKKKKKHLQVHILGEGLYGCDCTHKLWKRSALSDVFFFSFDIVPSDNVLQKWHVSEPASLPILIDNVYAIIARTRITSSPWTTTFKKMYTHQFDEKLFSYRKKKKKENFEREVKPP